MFFGGKFSHHSDKKGEHSSEKVFNFVGNFKKIAKF
jgi:hypothetical protein